MDGYTELAQLFKDRDNYSAYMPMIGTITALPQLKIKCGTRVELTADEVRPIFNIYETRTTDNRVIYIHLHKEVVLLPCSGYQRFIAIGVLQ